MKERILPFLACPSCGGRIEIVAKTGDEIESGELICDCKKTYPITNFIPRLLPQEIEDNQKKVQESFANKWKSQPKWGFGGEPGNFMREWVLVKYGWNDIELYREAIGSMRMILDAGCGLGREVANFCRANKEAEVFGVELSNCVDEAYENTKEFPNAHIIQADIMNLPFKPGIFDFIFSEGVLHHTPDTKKAFNSLVNHLTKGGEVAIYIYKVKGPIREFCDDYIRQYSTKLNLKECWKFSEAMTKLGKTLSDLKVELKVPEDIPILQIKAGRYDLQRFFYWNILKCFWNDRFSFEENNLVNFDWYHPAYAHRHTPDEVKSWFKQSDLEIVWFNVEESGITVRGKRV